MNEKVNDADVASLEGEGGQGRRNDPSFHAKTVSCRARAKIFSSRGASQVPAGFLVSRHQQQQIIIVTDWTALSKLLVFPLADSAPMRRAYGFPPRRDDMKL